MKKILIISDSHGLDDNMEKVIEEQKPMDVLIHLGDVEGSEDTIPSLVNPGCDVYILKGNNDYFSETLPTELELELDGHRIFLAHGHTYGVNYTMENLVDEAKERGCDIAMFGHTHRPYLDTIDGVTVLNPGSISYPRQQNFKPSYMVMNIDDEGRCSYNQYYIEKPEDPDHWWRRHKS